VEARYLVLSRGYREQEGVLVDPFDEMKRTTMLVRSLVAVGAVGEGDIERLAMTDSVEEFVRSARSRFHAWSSNPQERSIFETVVESMAQLCLEDGLAARIQALQADRGSFLRHRRGPHPRYAALAGRLMTSYERVFFAMHGDRALAQVNLVIAGWKRALRWYREGGVERDRLATAAAAFGGGDDDASAGEDGDVAA